MNSDGKGGDSPPPGKYEQRSLIGSSGPKRSMGVKLSTNPYTRMSAELPGPGHYNLLRKESAPTFTKRTE